MFIKQIYEAIIEQHQNNQIVGFGCRSLQHPRSFQTSSINKLTLLKLITISTTSTETPKIAQPTSEIA